MNNKKDEPDQQIDNKDHSVQNISAEGGSTINDVIMITTTGDVVLYKSNPDLGPNVPFQTPPLPSQGIFGREDDLKGLIHLLELEDKEIAIELIELIKSVASDINIKYGSCRVITNLGSYQDSKHLHFHIINGSHEDVK